MDKDEIVKDLIAKITSEALPQGHWLVERELCERYGLSRTPVREILRVLSTTGLVEQMPGKGYRVKELKFEDIIEIYNSREAVETMTTRLACKFGGKKLLDELAIFKGRLQGTNVKKDIIKAMDLGRNIHDAIADAAQNSILSEFYYKLKNLVALTRIITRSIPKVEENSKKYHLRLIEAMEKGNAEESENIMREHLRLTCKLTINGYINDRTGYDGGEIPTLAELNND